MMNTRRLYSITLLSFFTLMTYGQRQCEETCTHIHGIDISRYQGDISWDAVSKSRIAYCYVKATEGGDRVDPKYEQNLRACHNHGIAVGSYHFYRPKTDQKKQLENFLIQCNPAVQDLIPMIDIETNNGLPVKEFQDSLKKFLKLFRKVYRTKPLIYSGTNFYNKFLNRQVKRYPLMIAQYSKDEPQLADKHKILIWQYTGSGRLKGINGKVDKSRFLKRKKFKKIFK